MKIERILRVVWMSILLGIAMEIALLMTASGMRAVPGIKLIVADLAQKVSWSLIVCAGLAAGTAVSRARGPMMGLAGLVSAPAAFYAAKALHKSTLEALGAAVGAGGPPSALTVAVLKAVEYAWLGVALSWLGTRTTRPKHYGILGFLTGAVFAGIIYGIQVTQSATPPPDAALLSRAVNEILFPIGCSLVLFAATTLQRPKI
jgi:hypothetical protein